MMLWERMAEPLTAYTRSYKDDGEGGRTVVLTDPRPFMGTLAPASQGSGQQADAAAPTGEWELTCKPGESPAFYQVFRRDSDGRLFKVVSAPPDLVTPKCASFAFETSRVEVFAHDQG